MRLAANAKMAGLPSPNAGYSSRSSLSFICSDSPSSHNGNGFFGVLSHALSLYLAVPLRRRLIITSTFIVGLLLTATMKGEHLLWLLTTNVGAAPLLEWGQGTVFDYPGLRFGMDKKFTITVFSDLHFGEPESIKGPETDNKTLSVMNTVLSKEKSSLVVLNGDLITCDLVAPENVTSILDQVVSPLVKRKLPFATTFGNHDMSKTCNTRLMAEHLEDVRNKKGKQRSWAKPMVFGPQEQVGTSNYYIPVYGSTGGGNPHLVMMLWFFDSRGGRVFGKTDADGKDISAGNWVDQQVVSWFRLTNSAIREQHKRIIPSLAFVHIPVHATLAFQKKGGRTATTEPGIDTEVIGHQGDVCDSTGNNCTYEGADVPFMTALAETKGLMAVFSGHDHGIDWCMKWSKNKPLPNNNPATGNGVHFCFNRHSGYGGYSDWTRGARQIVIEEGKLGKNEIETWIRLEDGTVSGKVTLNSTYGRDIYKPVEETTSAKKEPGVDPVPLLVESSTTTQAKVSTPKPKPNPKPKPKPNPKHKPKSKPNPKSHE